MFKFKAIPVAEKVDRALFENEIRPLNRPVVLKGLIEPWPAVAAARESPEALGRYLKGFDIGRRADVGVCPAEHQGRYFYNDDVSGFNFTQVQQTLDELIDICLSQRGDARCDSRYLQAQPVDVFAPGLAPDLDMPLLDATVRPRLWLGNTLRTQTHFDLLDNIACHVAGEKLFTLFPPEQISNLYPGPLDMAPGGVPVSMVSLEDPDIAQFPRFVHALDSGEQARLQPGDALYMPSFWWHHVQTTGPLNMLVNYWWDEARQDIYPPLGTLYMGALSIKQLPPDQRKAWRNLIDFYLFESAGDPVGHLPEGAQGVFRRDISPEQMKQFKDRFRRTVKL